MNPLPINPNRVPTFDPEVVLQSHEKRRSLNRPWRTALPLLVATGHVALKRDDFACVYGFVEERTFPEAPPNDPKSRSVSYNFKSSP